MKTTTNNAPTNTCSNCVHAPVCVILKNTLQHIHTFQKGITDAPGTRMGGTPFEMSTPSRLKVIKYISSRCEEYSPETTPNKGNQPT